MSDNPFKPQIRETLKRVARLCLLLAHAGLCVVGAIPPIYMMERVRTTYDNHWGVEGIVLTGMTGSLLLVAGLVSSVRAKRVTELALLGWLIAFGGVAVAGALHRCNLLVYYDWWVHGMPEASPVCCRYAGWAKPCQALRAREVAPP
jgi:hypothetical protein